MPTIHVHVHRRRTTDAKRYKVRDCPGCGGTCAKTKDQTLRVIKMVHGDAFSGASPGKEAPYDVTIPAGSTVRLVDVSDKGIIVEWRGYEYHVDEYEAKQGIKK